MANPYYFGQAITGYFPYTDGGYVFTGNGGSRQTVAYEVGHSTSHFFGSGHKDSHDITWPNTTKWKNVMYPYHDLNCVQLTKEQWDEVTR